MKQFIFLLCFLGVAGSALAQAPEPDSRFSPAVLEKQLQKQNELADKIKEKIDRLITQIEKNTNRLEYSAQGLPVIQANMVNR